MHGSNGLYAQWPDTVANRTRILARGASQVEGVKKALTPFGISALKLTLWSLSHAHDALRPNERGKQLAGRHAHGPRTRFD